MKVSRFFAALVITAWVGGASSALPDGSGKDPDAKALEQWQGKWVGVASTIDGKQFKDEEVKAGYLLVKGTRVSSVRDGKETWAVNLRIDASRNPAHYDFVRKDGATLLGIYKLEGDTLTLCAGATDKTRPTEFSSKAGSGWLLSVLKRAK